MKLITATDAAKLLGVSTPTFYQMVKTAPEGSLLEPPESTGPRLWPLNNILAYITEKEAAEATRRRALLTEWGMESILPAASVAEG